MSAPTLINLPPPPSDPVTPSDIPGTPNSTTTSMSELSTVAIKDGHRGHPHHHSHRQQASVSDNTDAERADRISRLAGLERVATVRQASTTSLPPGASASHPQGYFDAPIPPPTKERSTVGSASATGSVGGRTTWASGSDMNEYADKMSEDQDMDASSAGGLSDEGNASLVGFGEGASSTVSGPESAAPASRGPQRQGLQPRNGASATLASREADSTPMTGVTATGPGLIGQGENSVHMGDATSYDPSGVNVPHGGPGFSSASGGAETAERIVRDRLDTSHDAGMMGSDGRKELGKFAFENRK